jgi:hypothetical protein
MRLYSDIGTRSGDPQTPRAERSKFRSHRVALLAPEGTDEGAFGVAAGASCCPVRRGRGCSGCAGARRNFLARSRGLCVRRWVLFTIISKSDERWSALRGMSLLRSLAIRQIQRASRADLRASRALSPGGTGAGACADGAAVSVGKPKTSLRGPFSGEGRPGTISPISVRKSRAVLAHRWRSGRNDACAARTRRVGRSDGQPRGGIIGKFDSHERTQCTMPGDDRIFGRSNDLRRPSRPLGNPRRTQCTGGWSRRGVRAGQRRQVPGAGVGQVPRAMPGL